MKEQRFFLLVSSLMGIYLAYFIQNTQCQLTFSERTPPKIGPSAPAMAMTRPTTAAISFFRRRGVISGKTIIVKENNP